jgi:hypothetical protein
MLAARVVEWEWEIREAVDKSGEGRIYTVM